MGTQSGRVVLEGVPRISFYEGGPRCPEDVPFPSALRAVLEYLGEDYGCRHSSASDNTWRLGCPYAHFMGTSGAAFFLSWKPGWHGDNVALHYMSDDTGAPYRRALDSVSCAHEAIGREEGRDNEAYFRSRIVGSIRDRGRPVLALGVVGPPKPSIIAGYDEGGDVLIGWSFFQGFPESSAGLEFEPSGQFRKRNWFPETHGLIVLGEKRERPAIGDIYREALRWGLEVMRTPITHGDRHNGHAAYTAWAEHLLRDEDFATDDLATLRRRFDVHDDAVGTVAEERWYGALFLSHAAQQMGGVGSSAALWAAASCFAVEHDLMWQVWGAVGGIGRSDEKARKLAESAVRRQVVGIIEQARDKDVEAANHIERALAT